MAADSRSRVLQAFKQYDFNDKKTIEFEQLMRILKVLHPCCADHDTEAALLAAGKLHNGTVLYEDFVDWVFDNPVERRRGSKEVAAEREAEKIASVKSKPRRAGIFTCNKPIDKSMVDNYLKPHYPKDDSSRSFIMKTLRENEKMKVLCGHLEDKDFQDLIDAFQFLQFSKGAEIIRQGAEGNGLYIVAVGQVDVFIARPNAGGRLCNQTGATVTYGPGALFGELALLYSTERAATVSANSDCVNLWALSQLDFKMLLARFAQHQLPVCEEWLRQVDIFSSLNYYELSRLSEALETSLFDEGEVIIQQGDPGDTFFLLEDGRCAAFIQGSDGEKEVIRYERKGDYFGELALLTSAPRKASVRALEGGCIVASISRDVFANVLGPLSDILTEREYTKYEEVDNRIL